MQLQEFLYEFLPWPGFNARDLAKGTGQGRIPGRIPKNWSVLNRKPATAGTREARIQNRLVQLPAGSGSVWYSCSSIKSQITRWPHSGQARNAILPHNEMKPRRTVFQSMNDRGIIRLKESPTLHNS